MRALLVEVSLSAMWYIHLPNKDFFQISSTFDNFFRKNPFVIGLGRRFQWGFPGRGTCGSCVGFVVVGGLVQPSWSFFDRSAPLRTYIKFYTHPHTPFLKESV